MVHIRLPYNWHSHLSVCPAVAPRLVPWHRRNWCYLFSRWGFAFCWHLLYPLACQVHFNVSKEVEIIGSHTTTWTCNWLWHYVTELFGASSIQPQNCNQWSILNSKLRVKKSLVMFDILTVNLSADWSFFECDVIGQVGLYISKDHNAFILRILWFKPDPENGGTIVLWNILNYSPNNTVSSQKTWMFREMSI
jgi:hypothetical protein